MCKSNKTNLCGAVRKWTGNGIMKADGPPGETSNGFNENLALFAGGHCGMWIDSTVASGLLYDPKQSQVSD